MANLIPEIAKMLGVDLGEEFKIKGYDGLTYKLTDNGLELTAVDGQKTKWFDHGALNSLLKGKMEIVKLPWKPKKEERCWYIIADPDCDNEESLIAVEDWWYGSFDEQIALKAGVVFRTRKEAYAALPAVEKEVGVEYELPSTEIVEPWKPKKGDVYYTFELLGDKWVVRSLWWGGFPNEYALLEKGWVYRTKEEAEAALPDVAAEMGVEYEL